MGGDQEVNPMDDLTALKSFRAERDSVPPEAREAIWRALEARIEAAAEESRAFAAAVASTAPRPATVRRRRGLGPVRRRRVLIFAAAALLAAIATSVLVLRSGPTAEPASAAEILHEAASAAAAGDAPATLVPGPGQFLYSKVNRLEVKGWVSPVPHLDDGVPTASGGGTMNRPDAYNAVVATQSTEWLGEEGNGRRREVLAGFDFWSTAEEDRWKAAGSPLPPPWNPEYQRIYKSAFDGASVLNAHVVDQINKGFGSSFHFPDTSKLPTKAAALRQAVEANAIEVSGFNLAFPQAERLDPEQTKEQLVNVMFEGMPSPALQAAIFNALAELPGIAIQTGATDALGREGDAIVLRTETGIRSEAIFDPTTGEVLATRSLVVDPKVERSLEEVPAGTTLREVDLIESGVVDSTEETGEAVGG
jgi:hypothetical protein